MKRLTPKKAQEWLAEERNDCPECSGPVAWGVPESEGDELTVRGICANCGLDILTKYTLSGFSVWEESGDYEDGEYFDRSPTSEAVQRRFTAQVQGTFDGTHAIRCDLGATPARGHLFHGSDKTPTNQPEGQKEGKEIEGDEGSA